MNTTKYTLGKKDKHKQRDYFSDLQNKSSLIRKTIEDAGGISGRKGM